MDALNLISLRREVQAHYEQRYGESTVHFDEFNSQTEDTVRVRITISKGDKFITRYYGTASYRNKHLHLDVMAI
jgi:hypothetical protein